MGHAVGSWRRGRGVVVDDPRSNTVNMVMRSLPLTNAAGPGGRPRATRAPANAFATWLATCGMTPSEVQDKLTAILRRTDPARWKVMVMDENGKLVPKMLSISMIYNTRNAYARPGRDLANAIAELSKGEVSTTSWPAKSVRPRKTPAKRVRKVAAVAKAV